MQFFLFSLLSLVFTLVVAVVPLGADTPAFHLVASSKNSASNLLPLRTSGGSQASATLTGLGPIGQFYFFQGNLIAAPAAGLTSTQCPFINSVLGSTGCSTYGSLNFFVGSSSNKCARYTSFQIQSNSENSQLGAKLVFNYVGNFYACGSGLDVYYKINSNEGPSNCHRIDLYTVPVA
ncbi:hypothetical protein AMATHDRAFT_137375 [Amanita thiersii Skay4041]|uniref:Ubiquitin 3 binding protein But2 C-terminal domain-containing protein n=1 Tax=Amanita thiersii Skay4041 TaxID=703135 RepID=A0A2A9NSU1_9AGAR|nr:hypothetical protein AMATHDRAFT_137375 [Amanita thiersii Skay4041]